MSTTYGTAASAGGGRATKSRETIQISLGGSSNAVTSHLLNLQGLAATTPSTASNNIHDLDHEYYHASASSSSSASYCDPVVTHNVENGTWIPRVLMIDEAHHKVSMDDMMTAVSSGSIAAGASTANDFDFITSQIFGGGNAATAAGAAGVPWTGPVAAVGMGLGPSSSSVILNSNNDPFWNAASTLAYSPYSRYRSNNGENDGYGNNTTSRMNVGADPEQSRHVLWDDNEEEEEEEEDQKEDPYELSRRKNRAFNQWNTDTGKALRQQLSQVSCYGSINSQVEVGQQQQTPAATATSSRITEQDLTWRDFWMPPRSNKSILSLPFSHQSRLDTHWEDTYTVESSTVRTWTEDVLFESFRHLLEASDGCQGVSIMTQGQGIYAGLTSVLLDEIQQECKSAGRLVNHVINPAEVAAKSSAEDNSSSAAVDAPTTTTSTSTSTKDDDEDMYATSTSWQQSNIRRVRTQIGSGIALHDFSEKAHVVLPLHLDHSLGSLFRSSAQLAIALEASSLPLRLRGGNTNNSRDYSIGLQNAPFFGTGGDDVRWGTTASSLTVTEYISMLRPSSSHPVLELDAVCNNKLTKSELWSAIRSGTSIERDDRMRHSGEIGLRGRPQDTQPGTWLGDSHNNTSPPGLLSSLSYTPEISKSVSNRSEHHHFTLSSAARPVLFDSTTSNEVAQYGSSPISDCLSCFIQGMGIRYRPQRSMVTLVDQSIGSLTFDGDGSGYGAGVYWKNLLSSGDCPVVSVVGNTTRSYVSLRATATNMRTSMGPRSRGYMNRDIMNGILPEKEDCEEALSRVWTLCDTYAPPSGSGYDSDDSG
mmetsp:Transcript_26989/g.64431  ORF Transcript_26989/g.64431 Transcript_26989/m.64431 type:complete len:818 (+) Transcript_26989:144-2597(+)